MRIRNKTGKVIRITFRAEGFDDDIETLKPGELSQEWSHTELDIVEELIVEEVSNEKANG